MAAIQMFHGSFCVRYYVHVSVYSTVLMVTFDLRVDGVAVDMAVAAVVVGGGSGYGVIFDKTFL